VLVGAAGGVLGGGAAWLLATVNSAGLLPTKIDFLLEFPVSLKFVFQGLLIGVLVGFLGSVIPAWSAQKISVIEAFSKAG
jgi:ABC-type antimicrobial peptide transport system permease subunit